MNTNDLVRKKIRRRPALPAFTSFTWVLLIGSFGFAISVMGCNRSKSAPANARSNTQTFIRRKDGGSTSIDPETLDYLQKAHVVIQGLYGPVKTVFDVAGESVNTRDEERARTVRMKAALAQLEAVGRGAQNICPAPASCAKLDAKLREVGANYVLAATTMSRGVDTKDSKVVTQSADYLERAAVVLAEAATEMKALNVQYRGQ